MLKKDCAIDQQKCGNNKCNRKNKIKIPQPYLELAIVFKCNIIVPPPPALLSIFLNSFISIDMFFG